MQRRYITVDVFTDRAFGGNPLAVVLDAGGLSTEQMQAVATEFNYSETTFVLPPADPAHDAQVRIFTVNRELPFAGHPNVGTAFVLATLAAKPPARLLFEEVHIKDEWVAAVKPQPTFAPFFALDCQARRLSGGSDGIRTRTVEFPRTRCFRPLRRPHPMHRRLPARGSRAVPPERWPEVVERAHSESLRALARAYGVSHNAIRTVLVTTDHAHLLNDEGRRQNLAPQVPLPPTGHPQDPHRAPQRGCCAVPATHPGRGGRDARGEPGDRLAHHPANDEEGQGEREWDEG